MNEVSKKYMSFINKYKQQRKEKYLRSISSTSNNKYIIIDDPYEIIRNVRIINLE